MSEDNKTLEEQLNNQAPTANNPESVIEENPSNPNSYSNHSFNDSTDNNSFESQQQGSSEDLQQLLAGLGEQVKTQQGQQFLGQLQQILVSLIQDKDGLLQANENLSQQLEDQNQQLEATKRRYIGLAAEFDNFRKRTLREKEEFEKQAKRKTLNELLTVVDDFERARRLIQPANDGEMAIHKSYQGVYKKFVDSLKSLGVSAMRTEGQLFDPMYHEALLSEPTNDYPEGTIIEELDRGYLLDDQVLRYAKVKVAAHLDGEIPETAKNTETLTDAQELNT